MLNKRAVFAFSIRWEVEDICAWLTQNMLEEHGGCLRENKVRGSTLLSSLKDGTLKTDLRDIVAKALGKSSHGFSSISHSGKFQKSSNMSISEVDLGNNFGCYRRKQQA